MTNESKQDIYKRSGRRRRCASGVLRLGAISAASGVLGGLAAAWWYRKTLTKLQNPIVSVDIPKTEYRRPLPDDLDWADFEAPANRPQ